MQLFSLNKRYCYVFLSVTSDCRVQYSRLRLEVKIYDTPARGIHASQGTFSSIYLNLIYLHILYMFVVLFDVKEFHCTL